MNDDSNKVWDKLTKQYISTAEKQAIIHEHNQRDFNKYMKKMIAMCRNKNSQ